MTPRFGYELESLRVKQGETDLSVTDNSFVMPEGDVTVTAAFRALPTLTLPAGLTEIGEEAFAGIAAEYVQVTENVVSIGSRAFADCGNLRETAIPAGVQTIADDALSGCTDVTVYGKTGSEAQRFAEANGFAFTAQ